MGDRSHLPESFYRTPESARTTLTRKQLRDTLTHHDGRIFACGVQWNICSRHLAVGVYEVTLTRTRDEVSRG